METSAALMSHTTHEDAVRYLASLPANRISIQNFINGGYKAHSDTEDWIHSHDPRSTKIIADVPRSSLDDVEAAIDSAQSAFPAWSETSREYRSEILLKIAFVIEQHKEAFAIWESLDQGKTITRARIEIERAISNFRYFATYILHMQGAVRYVDSQSVMTYEHRSPAGIFALITPWNMPLYLLTWKIAPCLAFGCVAVAKPSEITSITAFMLGEVFQKAGVPPGVVNLVFGDGQGVGSALVSSPRIAGVSFTGSVATGIRIRKDTAAHIGKHLSLELGGKNPTVIFDDVDLTKAVPLAAQAAFENSGQICLCGSRIYVQRRLYDEFVQQFTSFVTETYQCGKTIGPVVSEAHYRKIRSYLDLARQEAATFAMGEVPEEKPESGYWIKPTILTNVKQGSAIIQEEIFGPVVTVSAFDTEDEAIVLANDNANGLASVVMTTDGARMRRVGERVQAGLVWVNCWLVRELGSGFGGVKESGMGREGGDHSRDVFTNLHTIHLPAKW